MTTNYPTTLDNSSTLASSYTDSTPTEDEHAETHANLADAIIAIETELGTIPSGAFTTLVARLNDFILNTPPASQTIQPTGDFIAIVVQASVAQIVDLLQLKNFGGSVIGSWDVNGIVDATGYRQGGSLLASTHLSDTSVILKNPSPSIVTPSISGATMTGVPLATTQSASDNSTRIATTAYVISQLFAKLASPALTGTPTAPTASVDTNTTQIATTEFVDAQIDSTTFESLPAGSILPYGGSSAPSGWLLCDAAAVSRSTYSTLFTAISTAYGVGDGSTTFNVPDQRGRFAVGKGTHVDVDTLADSDGVTLASRRPSHAHSTSLSVSTQGDHSHGAGTDGGGDHNHSGNFGEGSSDYKSGSGGTVQSSGGNGTGSGGSHAHSFSWGGSGNHGHTVGGTVGTAGVTDTIPYLTINYIIKT